MRSYEDGEIWDEYQWEAHLNEMEQKSEKLRSFIESNLGEESPRWSRFLHGFTSKLDAIDAYIEDELMFEDAYFPDDEDDWDEDDDEMDDFFMSGDDFGEEDTDEGEEWKLGLPEELRGDAEEGNTPVFSGSWFTAEGEIIDPDFAEMPHYNKVYDEARELAADMLKLAELTPPEEQDVYFLQMISETVNIGAKIAGGFAFGYDPDVLGGNIAYCKRAINSANQVLAILPGLRQRKFMQFVDYRMLHERMFELRNDIGIIIQELREMLRESL